MVGDEDFRVNGWANYVGPSRLGIGPVLGESQGDYVDTGLAMRVGNNRRGLSLTVTNLFDSRGNRFSLGTPFLEGNEGFLTPLHPRTLRSEEHTSELQSLMRISYAVFCLKKNKHYTRSDNNNTRPTTTTRNDCTL